MRKNVKPFVRILMGAEWDVCIEPRKIFPVKFLTCSFIKTNKLRVKHHGL